VLSDQLQEKVLLDVLKFAGLTGPDQNLPASVRVKHGTNRNGRTIHYYLNYSANSETVTYPYGNGSDLLSAEPVRQSQEIVLKPWDLAIVEEK
jgi:beta-galactosidase